jgi:hypothetical protein
VPGQSISREWKCITPRVQLAYKKQSEEHIPKDVFVDGAKTGSRLSLFIKSEIKTNCTSLEGPFQAQNKYFVKSSRKLEGFYERSQPTSPDPYACNFSRAQSRAGIHL